LRFFLSQGWVWQSKGFLLAGVPSGSWNYNSDDELSSETYDQNGNVTAADGKTFGYDSQNELVTMNGGAVQLMYDGDGNRVAKAVTSGGVTTTTYYLVDDLNPTGLPQIMDELTNGVVTRTYTYGLQRISEEQIVSGAWTPSFYSYDGMGSVRQLTSMTGAVTDTYEYDAFGNEITHTGTTPNNYLYRGEQYDSDLGLYYLRARYYNPLSGRFMSRDPYDGNKIIPNSLHKYLYAAGDPVNRIDPRGRADLFGYVIRTNAAIPEAKLIDIYGCIANASLTAVDLMLDQIDPSDTTANIGTVLGSGSAVIGCVVLAPGLNELADEGNKIVKSAQWVGEAAGWGSCAADAEDFINALNDLATGQPAGDEISKSIEHLGGCVGNVLGKMFKGD